MADASVVNAAAPGGEGLPMTVEDIIKAGDGCWEKNDFQGSYDVYGQGVKDHPDDVTIRVSMARSCHDIAQERLARNDTAGAEAAIREGVVNVEAALILDPQDFQANRWAAILLGKVGDYDGMKAKIQGAFRVKELALKASSINPTDASVQHVLGVWCFSVANVGWVQRKLAQTLIATPPESTYEEAEGFLLKAAEHSDVFFENDLKLGELYVAMGKKDEARKWYQKAIDTPVQSGKHKMLQDEAAARLAAL
eukprot:TRINITY_DN29583_c0_g1_i1.p1 TRINITY_DN29583_c0_g1~~TRINITY_DN29583_c0_g1_i1.p1  ORF type:complete len:252 (-),score=56.62 TRINITY_DN29583_c0_g1_i1:100-855(-)